MKNFILNVGEKLFIPTCIIFISYRIFYRYIAFLPYLIILKVILLLLAAIQIIAWALGKFGNAKRNNKLRLSNNNVVKSFYLHSRRIITLVFSYYFAVYLIFFLDKRSVLYNYLILLLFGLYLGYEIAVIANRYKK